MASSTATSPEDVLRTFAKLLKQAQSSRAGTWSVRTLDRAYHWAALAEQLRPPSSAASVGPRAEMLFSLLENPCSAPAVAAEARARLESLPGTGAEMERRAEERLRVVRELERALKDAQTMGLSADEVLSNLGDECMHSLQGCT